MKNKSFICVAIFILSIFAMSGCSSFQPESTNMETDYQYSHTFDNGLELKLGYKMEEENLAVFKFELEDTTGLYSSIENNTAVSNAEQCYLTHRAYDEMIKGFGDLSTNTIFFENVTHDISEYTLHFEYPVTITDNKEYPVTIPITENEKIYKDKTVKLPFGNYIEINKTSIRNDFDKMSDKCIDINFTLGPQVTDCDLRIVESKVTTGAPLGMIAENGNKNYTYSHPIKSDEKEITIAFINTQINTTCQCDIPL